MKQQRNKLNKSLDAAITALEEVMCSLPEIPKQTKQEGKVRTEVIRCWRVLYNVRKSEE